MPGNVRNLRKHQRDAIWRGIYNERGMYGHEVGTGKTFTMAGIAVESRRYGKAKKPIILAHNANSSAVYAEAQEMYPGGQFLYVDNLDPNPVGRDQRHLLMAGRLQFVGHHATSAILAREASA